MLHETMRGGGDEHHRMDFMSSVRLIMASRRNSQRRDPE